MDFALDAVDTRTRSNEGVDMPVLQPGTRLAVLDKDGQPVTIRLVGVDSDIYRRRIRDATIEQIAAKTAAISAEEFDRNDERAIELLAACTVGWSGVNTPGPDGSPIPCTAENVREMYRKYPAIRAQVDAFIVDRSNFLLG